MTSPRDATNKYGLLVDVIGVDSQHDNLTGIDTYIVPTKPATYDPTIQGTLSKSLGSSAIVFFKALSIVDNLRDALDEQYYAQPKQCLTAYPNITSYQILPLTSKQGRSYAKQITPNGTATSISLHLASTKMMTSLHLSD
jgi:hypothetical protein